MDELDHIGIAVASVEDAKRLFIDLLGMRLVNEGASPEFGLRFARVATTDGTTVELLEYDRRGPDAPLATLDHVAFAVRGLDAVIRGLERHGVHFDRVQPTETIRTDGVDRTTTTLPGTTLGLRVQLVEHVARESLSPDGSESADSAFAESTREAPGHA